MCILVKPYHIISGFKDAFESINSFLIKILVTRNMTAFIINTTTSFIGGKKSNKNSQGSSRENSVGKELKQKQLNLSMDSRTKAPLI